MQPNKRAEEAAKRVSLWKGRPVVISPLSGGLTNENYLVESEGNHYATYLLMAKGIDDAETDRRLDYYLDLDAKLIRQPNPLPMLH